MNKVQQKTMDVTIYTDEMNNVCFQSDLMDTDYASAFFNQANLKKIDSK